MHVEPSGSTTSACQTKEEAIAKQQNHCRYCELTGHVAIFHKAYTGMPTMSIVDHNGEERERRACIVAHCSCEVGLWMRHYTSKDMKARIPSLHDVAKGDLRNWSLMDPTLLEVELPDWEDWKEFRKWLASLRGGAVRKVYPASAGNKVSAYREMGEPMPNQIPTLDAMPV